MYSVPRIHHREFHLFCQPVWNVFSRNGQQAAQILMSWFRSRLDWLLFLHTYRKWVLSQVRLRPWDLCVLYRLNTQSCRWALQCPAVEILDSVASPFRQPEHVEPRVQLDICWLLYHWPWKIQWKLFFISCRTFLEKKSAWKVHSGMDKVDRWSAHSYEFALVTMNFLTSDQRYTVIVNELRIAYISNI